MQTTKPTTAIPHPAHVAQTRGDDAAARRFIAASKAWQATRNTATEGFRGLCERISAANGTHARALGLLSQDPLNMTVSGVLFDRNPGEGFLAVPPAYPITGGTPQARAKGFAVVPDPGSPDGAAVIRAMKALSRIHEDRPLLKSDAIAAAAIDPATRKLVLSAAIAVPSGNAAEGWSPVIIAHPLAVRQPQALQPYAPTADTVSADPPSEARTHRINLH